MVRLVSTLPLHSSITCVAKAVYAVSILQSPVEKPNKFDPFGQKESAHLIYHTIAPLKVLVMGVNFILPF